MIFMCWTTAGLPMCRMRSSGFSRGSFRKWNFSARAGNVEKSVLPADGILFAGAAAEEIIQRKIRIISASLIRNFLPMPSAG